MARDVLISDAELIARCRVLPVARGGPGGQHANKTASGVRIHHVASGVEAMCCEHREGRANRSGALRRLRVALACRLRGGGDPAVLALQVRGGRLLCGPAAASWPGVVAMLLDAVSAANGELKPAALVCHLNTSQLAKALVADQPVRAAADAIRRAAGLSTLRA
jgi:hypothetical protein